MHHTSLRQSRTRTSMGDSPPSPDRPYPQSWDDVAEIRVFRTTPERWQRLIGWQDEMKAKGWRLLLVSELEGDLTAVFGRTRDELLGRTGTA